jgi:hypothetical protein
MMLCLYSAVVVSVSAIMCLICALNRLAVNEITCSLGLTNASCVKLEIIGQSQKSLDPRVYSACCGNRSSLDILEPAK